MEHGDWIQKYGRCSRYYVTEEDLAEAMADSPLNRAPVPPKRFEEPSIYG